MKHNALLKTGIITYKFRDEPPRYCSGNKKQFSDKNIIQRVTLCYSQIRNNDFQEVYLGFKTYLL